jgi:hypothetical protein
MSAPSALADQVVRRAPKAKKSEFDSRSVKPTPRASMEMPPLGEALEREPNIVLAEKDLTQDYYEKLKFAEEPLTILIHRSGERNAANCTDLISNQGILAEMLFKNGWVQIGYLPRGQQIVVKRKTVEQIASAKMTHISTRVVERDGEDPRNFVDPVTASVNSFSVIDDKNPRGVEWLSQLLRMN